jgi:protein TonB
VYLDIGAENGGIILDLSEAGAGVQAVAPLQVLGDISIRFQLPDSPKKVQTEAQIAWASETRRRVGLRFTNAQEEVRVQIRDWIRSQSPPSPESLAGAKAVTPPQLESAPSGGLEQRLPSSLAKGVSNGENVATSLEPQLQTPPEPAVANDVLRGFLCEIAAEKIFAETAADGFEAASTAAGDRRPVDKEAFKPNLHRSERADVINWPETIPEDPIAEPGPLTSAAIPVTKPSASTSGAEKLPISSQMTGPTPTRGAAWWKIAIAMPILLAVSFEAGKWLESPHAPIAPPGLARTSTQQRASGVERRSPYVTAKETRSLAVREHRREHRQGSVISQPASSPAPSLTAPLPTSSTVPTTPPVLPNPASPPIDTAPATQASPPPPTPDSAGSAQASPPAVIGGRVLTATDRFNPAHLLYRFDPDYPPEAKQENIEGTVMLRVAIDATGAVNHVQVLSGPALLVPAAVSAVKNWRYLPALLNGEPVKTEQYVSVDFRLPAGDQ